MKKNTESKFVMIPKLTKTKWIENQDGIGVPVNMDESISELIAIVDNAETSTNGAAEDVILMIKVTYKSLYVKSTFYEQFIKRLKTTRPNLYSKYLNVLGVIDFVVSFNNHFKKLLPGKTQNMILFILFFPFKFTYITFAGIFGGEDDSDGNKVASVLMFIIWAFVLILIGRVFGQL
jgi:hypothetical protein